MFNKVAQITVFFWLLKILATTLGETAGDMLSMTLDLGYVTGLLIIGGLLLVILFAQITVKRFHPALYWLAIIGTTTTGTEISDMMDRTFGLGYFWGSIVLVTGLLLTLGVWYAKEKSLQVYPIFHRAPEIFFWIAVLFSNSLGTAFGDYLTDNAGLSYIQGALVTGGIIGIVVALHYLTKLNDALLFWIAFIFTRPFGATFGDLLTKTHDKGGFDLGTIPASIVTVILFIALLILSRKVYAHEDHKLQKA